MRGLKSVLLLAVAIGVCCFLVGCAAQAPPNGPSSLNIAQFTLSQGAIGVPYRQALIASGGLEPYTWSISSGALPAGLSIVNTGPMAGLISGTPSSDPSQYSTAGCALTNNSFPITCNFAAQVTDSQSPIQAVDTKGFSIIINLDLTLTPVSLGNGVVGEAFNATFMAINGVPAYSYAVAAGGVPCGSDPEPLCPAPGLTLTTVQSMNGMANPATITGTPTTAGVYSFTVQATDSIGETATATFTITITGRLNGPYALTLNGFDTSQPAGSQAFYMLADVTASNDMNGSGMLAGVLDQNGPGGTISSAVQVTGTYTLPVGTNFGSLSLTRADTHATYQFNIVVSTINDSKLILVDPNNVMWGSGLLKKQTMTTISGTTGASYTFGFFGNDPSGGRLSGAGAFALNTSLVITGGVEDTNDNGTVSGEQCITGGSLSSPDPTTGRGTATLMVAPLSGGTCGTAVTYSYTYYVVTQTELIAVANDSNPAAIVDIQQQQSAGITGGGLVLCKRNSTCQNAIQLDGIAGTGDSAVPEAQIGVMTVVVGDDESQGTISRTDGLPGYHTDQSVGGTLGSVSFTSGTYTIDAMCGPIMAACGRVTLNIDGDTNPPVFYLYNTGQGFIVGTDAYVEQGTLQPQTGFPYSLPSLLGSYLGGTITPATASITNEVDVASTPPPGGVWVQKYQTSGPGGAQPGMMPLSLQCTSGTDGCPYVLDATYGAAFGKFLVTNDATATSCESQSCITILYLVGGGQQGVTGGKTGVAGMNVGILQSDGSVQSDPNPRLSTFGR